MNIGDKVHVLVDVDDFGDKLDTLSEYVIKRINNELHTVGVGLADGSKINGIEYWVVNACNVIPSIRDVLARKMNERTRLDAEIAELEQRLEAGGR